MGRTEDILKWQQRPPPNPRHEWLFICIPPLFSRWPTRPKETMFRGTAWLGAAKQFGLRLHDWLLVIWTTKMQVWQFQWPHANCSLRFWFSAERSGTWFFAAWRHVLLCIQRCFSAYISCDEGLFTFQLPSFQFKAVWQFSDLEHQQSRELRELPFYFSFSHHSL